MSIWIEWIETILDESHERGGYPQSAHVKHAWPRSNMLVYGS